MSAWLQLPRHRKIRIAIVGSAPVTVPDPIPESDLTIFINSAIDRISALDPSKFVWVTKSRRLVVEHKEGEFNFEVRTAKASFRDNVLSQRLQGRSGTVWLLDTAQEEHIQPDHQVFQPFRKFQLEFIDRDRLAMKFLRYLSTSPCFGIGQRTKIVLKTLKHITFAG